MAASGERVKLARELRGLTQTQLAARTGVSQSTIAYIESGRLSPSEGLLSAIAMQTGFPTSFFKQEPPSDFPLGSLLYRARAATTSTERITLHRYAGIMFELATKMSRRFKPIPVRLPQLVDEPAPAAEITRAALGLSPDKPVENLIHTLERAGVLVLALPISSRTIDAFSLWAGPNGEMPVIALTTEKPTDRLRFSIAHELGHLVLHRSLYGKLSDIEREANAFASEFLLPEAAMRQEIVPPVTLTGLAGLKQRWRVSIQALIRRAYDLKIITERQYRYLFQQIGLMGWRVEEPGSLELPPERPRLLRQMAEMIYGVPLNYKRIATDMHLSSQLVEELLGGYAGRQTESDNQVRSPKGVKVISFPGSENA